MAETSTKKPKAMRMAAGSGSLDGARVGALLDAFRAAPRLAPVVEAFEAARVGPRKFGSNGLKVDGKLFALFTQGTLVVKLPPDRVAELVASHAGTPFDPGHGRLMKGWLTVTSPNANWVELAKEAHACGRRRDRRDRSPVRSKV